MVNALLAQFQPSCTRLHVAEIVASTFTLNRLLGSRLAIYLIHPEWVTFKVHITQRYQAGFAFYRAHFAIESGSGVASLDSCFYSYAKDEEEEEQVDEWLKCLQIELFT